MFFQWVQSLSATITGVIAIPKLFHQLALSGCIVTIDAMGTQVKIAKQMVEDDGDSV
ncbi:MAG: hypothetical protein M3Y76_10625 [Chloroflexota bacterium]|nr:hypothetical protein [Chloroflexota bacterium]